MAESQNYKNHVRLDPKFHFSLVPFLLFLLGWSIWHLVKIRSALSWWEVGIAVALVWLALVARLYALKVQDRLIRLEERLRLTALGGEGLRRQLGQLSEAQLIALRFASDTEAAPLAEQAIVQRLTPRQIKQSIKDWRADHFRV